MSTKIKTVKDFSAELDKRIKHDWPVWKIMDEWIDYAQTLEEEIKRLRKEYKAMSKGAQSNAEVIKIQAQKMLDQNEKIAKLKEACELGLEFAQEDLARSKNDFAGYPDRWELTENYIKQIEEELK